MKKSELLKLRNAIKTVASYKPKQAYKRPENAPVKKELQRAFKMIDLKNADR